MKKYISILFCGGALLIGSCPSKAESYYLYSTIDWYGQKGTVISRTPKRPLCIDLTNHTITVSSEVVGCSLTLISKEGYTYNYLLLSNKLFLPDSLEGEFEIVVSNEYITYIGQLYI